MQFLNVQAKAWPLIKKHTFSQIYLIAAGCSN